MKYNFKNKDYEIINLSDDDNVIGFYFRGNTGPATVHDLVVEIEESDDGED